MPVFPYASQAVAVGEVLPEIIVCVDIRIICVELY
jgi:hypothetical protein